MKVNRN